jgi:formylglycine-generating enzyme required for sulfatase activity
MSAATQLLAFGLRQVIDAPPGVAEDLADMAVHVAEAAGAAGKVIALVRQRLIDHSETLPAALARANDRAWQAVAVALAGRGFFTPVKEFFTGRTPRVLHEQVEAFLAQNAGGFPGTSEEFRRTCLRELHQAGKAGLLAAGRPDPDGWARQAAAYRGLADPHARVAEARQAAAAVAGALPGDYPNLARLLKEAAPAGQAPLLVAAFSFFFRREVETNAALGRGLTFEGLRQLATQQETALAALEGLDAQLQSHGQQLGSLLEQLVGIDAKLDAISAQIAELASRNHVPTGPPRPQFVITINNEREQALARRLLAEVRKLPPERQRADDLAMLGDVLRAAGLYPEAQQSYAGAAEQSDDRAARAANHYKLYLTALEQRRWDEALAALTAAAALDDAQFAPFPLQKYEARRILGAGGFGAAVLCWDRDEECDVVVKSLHHAELEQGVTTVFAEAKVLRLLGREHPSIIGVHHCSYADAARTRPYIVMDYFPGVSLQAHLEQLGPKAVLPLADFLPIARQVAEAMRASHGRGVLHRDLKPDNVLVRNEDGRWQVKVIDFGLAIRARAVQVSTSRPAQERTLYGDSAAGTARYAPPEQMGEMPGVKVDTYSDVFAFGKLCCYALFRDTEPKPRHWKTLPDELVEMLAQCIEKDLEHRHKTFEPVLTVLEVLESIEMERQRQEEEARRQLQERQQREREEAERRRQEEEARCQAEAERHRQEQARRAEAQRRQGEEARRQTEERQRREEAERRRQEQEIARLQQEGEAKLIRLVRDALNRTRGHSTEDDMRVALELCRQHHLPLERARVIAREVREQWQKEQPREPRPGEVVTNSLGMNFAWIPPDTLLMGSPSTEAERSDVETQHQVALTKGYYLGIHQVTRGQFANFVKDTGYRTEAERYGGAHSWTGKEWKLDPNKNWRTPGFAQTDDHPVVCISWNDAVAWCDWLTKQDGRARIYRLPTEAEWEYACRAGTTTPFSFGETISTDQANYDGNYVYGEGKKGVFRQATTPVGSFPANAWGLYDMHGNVWEWCQDRYGPYPQGDVKDRKAAAKGDIHILRGGSWYSIPYGCRSAHRHWISPAIRGVGYGCRVVFCLD